MSEHQCYEFAAARIAGKKPIGYDDAAELLVDLREVPAPVGFARRTDQLRQGHGRRPAFIARRVHPGLWEQCR